MQHMGQDPSSGSAAKPSSKDNKKTAEPKAKGALIPNPLVPMSVDVKGGEMESLPGTVDIVKQQQDMRKKMRDEQKARQTEKELRKAEKAAEQKAKEEKKEEKTAKKEASKAAPSKVPKRKQAEEKTKDDESMPTKNEVREPKMRARFRTRLQRNCRLQKSRSWRMRIAPGLAKLGSLL